MHFALDTKEKHFSISSAASASSTNDMIIQLPFNDASLGVFCWFSDALVFNSMFLKRKKV
jgi:hypothetical protein